MRLFDPLNLLLLLFLRDPSLQQDEHRLDVEDEVAHNQGACRLGYLLYDHVDELVVLGHRDFEGKRGRLQK
jgi:hypothetical protein